MDTAPKIVDFNEKRYDYKRQVNYGEVFRMKEGKNMDDLLKSYIEKVDRDQSALREDIRESERRIHKFVEDSERRMDVRLDRIENMIADQDKKLDNIKDTVNDRMTDNRKFMWGIVLTIILSIIASIGVIISTYQSSISLIQQFLTK